MRRYRLTDVMLSACYRWEKTLESQGLGFSFEIVSDTGLLIGMNGHYFRYSINQAPFNSKIGSAIAGSKTATYACLRKERDLFSLGLKLPLTFSYEDPVLALGHDTSIIIRKSSIDDICNHVETNFPYSVFVKPDNGTLSAFASKVENRLYLKKSLKAIFNETSSVYAVIQEHLPIKREIRGVFLNGACIFMYEYHKIDQQGASNSSSILWTETSRVAVTPFYNSAVQAQIEESAKILANNGLIYQASDFAILEGGDVFFLEANANPLVAHPCTKMTEGGTFLEKLGDAHIEYMILLAKKELQPI
jgi:hypothetical protein